MSGCSYAAFHQVSCASRKPPKISYEFDHTKASFSSARKRVLRELPKIPTPLVISDIPKAIKEKSVKLLDKFVDHAFEFVIEPYLPSQSNFAPVDEIGEGVQVIHIEGNIPDEFPEGVFLRNGPNPIDGGLRSATSIFGKTSQIWVEGEGMIHGLSFNRKISDVKGGNINNINWSIVYNNKYVETDTYKLDKLESKKPPFIPSVEGNSTAVLSAFLLNMLRFGKVNQNASNTSVFEHSGRYYSISEDNMPQEIDIRTLQTIGTWDTIHHSWNRPFSSHPKKDPETGDLVTFGFDARKPYLVVGCISADGKKLIHKVDLKLERSVFSHEIGITQRYNIILDFPIIIDETRLFFGGSLIKFEKEKYARIGVMPRHGDSDSLRWFGVEPCTALHIINCYEEGDEVVVMACRAEGSVIPGPDPGIDKFEWFSRGFKHFNSINGNSDEGFLFSRPFMWRLDMKTGLVKDQSYLTGTEFSMDFPFINQKITGLKNKYGYVQVVDSNSSSVAGIAKYNGLAKLWLEKRNLIFSEGKEEAEEVTKVEYHMLPENTFCTGSAFVAKNGGAVEEDDGWIVTFVHNEAIDISQVYIVDAKKFSSEPVVRITLPSRVPYGFHGAFMPFN